MGKCELYVNPRRRDDHLPGRLMVAFFAFLAGCFFGYIWMSHAYGLWP